MIGKASVFILNQIDFGMKQGRTIFLFAAVIVGYALPSVAGGNGYLSVYLCGILIGNRFIPDKKEMVHFFDILTEIAQMVIFFLLGLLVTPSQLPEVFVPALLLCLFMLFIGRPVSVLAILSRLVHPGSRSALFPGPDCGEWHRLCFLFMLSYPAFR